MIAGLPLAGSLRSYGWRLLIGLPIFALAAAGILGEALTRPVNHPIGPIPADLVAHQTQSIVFPDPAGRPIHGWFVPGRPGHGAVVLLHGVRGDRTSMLNRARILVGVGYSVLLFDFQAHGESPGDRISFGYFELRDAQAAVAWLRRRLPGQKIGAIGVSLGGAAALLGDLNLDAWVLEMVYPTIHEAVGNRLARFLGPIGWAATPLLTGQCWLRFGVDADALRPIDHIGRIRSPKLLISGSLDPHTPRLETEALFAAAASPKELWIVDGAKHVDLYEFDPDTYRRRVLAFFDSAFSDYPQRQTN